MRNTTARGKLFGKYRGIVLDNVDPLRQGRLKLQVPDLASHGPLGWAMPCAPVAGPGNGIQALPVVGAGVWVEFERGDPDFPIWVGCFWASAAEVPALALATPPGTQAIILETQGQNGISISDAPGAAGGILLRTAAGAALVINATGIHISNGQGASISLVGPSVTVNNGALTVV